MTAMRAPSTRRSGRRPGWPGGRPRPRCSPPTGPAPGTAPLSVGGPPEGASPQGSVRKRGGGTAEEEEARPSEAFRKELWGAFEQACAPKAAWGNPVAFAQASWAREASRDVEALGMKFGRSVTKLGFSFCSAPRRPRPRSAEVSGPRSPPSAEGVQDQEARPRPLLRRAGGSAVEGGARTGHGW